MVAARGRHAAATLLAGHPDIDAVFCGSDQIAYGVTETLRDLGWSIPGDIAVVGYDNWEVIAAECRPPLTTVDLNLQQLGASAVHHLFAALDGSPVSGVVREPAHRPRVHRRRRRPRGCGPARRSRRPGVIMVR